MGVTSQTGVSTPRRGCGSCQCVVWVFCGWSEAL